MDTILYLYKKKDLEKPLVEAIGRKTYLLIKIGMDVEPYRWFLQCLPHKQLRPDIDSIGGKMPEGWDRINPRYFKERQEIRRRRKEWKKYEALIDTLMARCRRNVESQLTQMMRELSLYVEERFECWCVYDRAVRDVLYGDDPVAEIWKQSWKMEEFSCFTESRWMQLLLPHAVCHHFIILGEASCIPQILNQCVDRMKSLRWIVDEAYWQTHREELEDFAESFYQEQGLAVAIEQVQGKNGFEKLQPACREPVNILDFTGEDKVSAGWAAKGSIWLDMGSSEEKCRRITQHNTKIQYFSLREKWRQTQKISHYLDTVNKNEYNT